MRISIIVLAIAGLTLSACGRRGELYYPDAQSQTVAGFAMEASRE